MAWASSDRRARLPADWPKRREQVAARANGRCEGITLDGTRGHVDTCDRIGNECDHIIQGDNHALSNLAWLSPMCHAAKTQAEAAQARAQREAMRSLPTEDHPLWALLGGRGEAPPRHP